MKMIRHLAVAFGMLWFGIAQPAHAQNIPDAHFADAIRVNCPACIDVNNNLTASAANLDTLDVSNSDIASLTGIGGFSELKVLKCGSNQLTALPGSLFYLATGNTSITCIPNQPTDLFMVPELPLCSQPCNPMLSIHNAPPAKPFVIQPNPVTDFIHVNFPSGSGAETEILLFNANGQIIYLLRGKGNLTIPAGDFPVGIYWLKLKMAEGIFWKKIVKL